MSTCMDWHLIEWVLFSVVFFLNQLMPYWILFEEILNGAPIPVHVETSSRYLGHTILNDLNGHESILCIYWDVLLKICRFVPSELVHILWNFFLFYLLLQKRFQPKHLVGARPGPVVVFGTAISKHRSTYYVLEYMRSLYIYLCTLGACNLDLYVWYHTDDIIIFCNV